MTNDILKGYGIDFDIWSMTPKFDVLVLKGNKTLFSNQKMIQYYFSSDGVIFIRKLDGKLIEVSPEVVPESGYAKVFLDGKSYKAKIRDNGFSNSEIGIFHDMVGISSLIGIHKF